MLVMITASGIAPASKSAQTSPSGAAVCCGSSAFNYMQLAGARTEPGASGQASWGQYLGYKSNLRELK